MNVKEIILPEGFEVSEIKDGKIILKEVEKEPAKSWEEWVDKHPVTEGECYIDNSSDICVMPDVEKRFIEEDDNLLPSEEHAEAILSLIKLKRLIEDYQDPGDTKNPIEKSLGSNFFGYHLCFYGKEWVIRSNFSFFSYMFRFPTLKRAEQFKENFADLLHDIEILYI